MRPSRPTADLILERRAPGAYLVRGTAVDWALAARLRDLARALFALPEDALAAIDMLRSPHFRGYSHVGSEITRGRADLREQLDLAPERVPDANASAGPAWRRLPGPNQWPAELPDLRPAILGWMEQLEALSHRIAAQLFADLGLPLESLDGVFAPDPWTRLKIVHYPGVPEPEAQGVGAHSDTGFLTLILDDGSGGLFVRDGERAVEVRAPADALIMVIGRTFAAFGGDAIPPAEHFVVAPPLGGERISIPYFFAPRLDAVIEGRAFGESALDVLLRSHPTVAERHHPDLLAAR